MEIYGLISLLKLLISIQEQFLITELILFLESILIPFPEQIQIPESILESTSRSTPESAPTSESIPVSKSNSELIPNTEMCRSDSELPPLDSTTTTTALIAYPARRTLPARPPARTIRAAGPAECPALPADTAGTWEKREFEGGFDN